MATSLVLFLLLAGTSKSSWRGVAGAANTTDQLVPFEGKARRTHDVVIAESPATPIALLELDAPLDGSLLEMAAKENRITPMMLLSARVNHKSRPRLSLVEVRERVTGAVNQGSNFSFAEETLFPAVGHWLYNKSDAELLYGGIESWNVSGVTYMAELFEYATKFNADIGQWNVAHVTSMEEMFNTAARFNQDISQWNVRKVGNFEEMFREASSFNQDLSMWNISTAWGMEEMFHHATMFNQDLSKWNVEHVSTDSIVVETACEGTNRCGLNPLSMLVEEGADADAADDSEDESDVEAPENVVPHILSKVEESEGEKKRSTPHHERSPEDDEDDDVEYSPHEREWLK